ncbi:hypothetical protein [Photobacterium halotolerans]|uniref:hypothetical protein n=1 Tax=Photobacterium halotolerans TaxID=265726 RepID=UPI0013726039|nr:hypothetical protein [Photobacterium halotolerans]NAW86628.1 hypothetical protein [Photobacterium halotolerans]
MYCPACNGNFVTYCLNSWLCADCGATKESPRSRVQTDRAPQKLRFDELFAALKESNKHIVIPMLIELVETEEQIKKLHRASKELKFDLNDATT